MPSIDFAELRRVVTLADLLRAIGWQLVTQNGPQLRGPCPIHKSARPRSRSFAVNGAAWYCHSCKRHGFGALDLWMVLNDETSPHAAAVALCALMRIDLPQPAAPTSGAGNRKRNR